MKANADGGDDEENTELLEMTRCFWIGATLTLPVSLLAMAHMIPALGPQARATGDVSCWIQFVLATPVVGWAGCLRTSVIASTAWLPASHSPPIVSQGAAGRQPSPARRLIRRERVTAEAELSSAGEIVEVS